MVEQTDRAIAFDEQLRSEETRRLASAGVTGSELEQRLKVRHGNLSALIETARATKERLKLQQL